MQAKRLRIAMLIWSYWPGHEGGAERQCRKLIPHLAAQDLEIVVWTAWTRWGHLRKESLDGCEIVRLGGLVPFLMAVRRGLDGLLARIFRGTAEKSRSRARSREALSFWFGLPLTVVARISFLLELWLWLRKPAHRPDVIHVHESSWMAGAAAFLARRHGIPVLAKTAIYPAWDVLGYDVPLRRTFSRARRECRFVALAQYLADDLLAHGVPSDHIFLVPNGVEIPERAEAPSTGRDVLFVANFSQSVEQKAFDVLLNAWNLVSQAEPAARLFLLGDGDRTQWEGMVKAMRLESSAQFTGWTPDPAEYYRRAALFVLPSRWEGMSNSLLEAQSWGLACVVSDIPGNRAVVEDGLNGLVVPVGDEQALAQAILRLLGDDALREKLGGNARRRMMANYSIDSVALHLRGIYERLSPAETRGSTGA
jgi:glycosyltransferase involved in cell wall biosynthesis